MSLFLNVFIFIQCCFLHSVFFLVYVFTELELFPIFVFKKHTKSVSFSASQRFLNDLCLTHFDSGLHQPSPVREHVQLPAEVWAARACRRCYRLVRRVFYMCEGKGQTSATAWSSDKWLWVTSHTRLVLGPKLTGKSVNQRKSPRSSISSGNQNGWFSDWIRSLRTMNENYDDHIIKSASREMRAWKSFF